MGERKPWDKGGLTRHQQGYGSGWEKVRKEALERDCYLCQPCQRAGRVTAAREVDHITPKARGGTDALRNLQSICRPCHTTKTARDNGRRVKPTFGADGWPIEQ